MQPPMLRQMVLVFESFVANLAFVWSLARVLVLVPCQRTLLGECLVTLVTDELSLSLWIGPSVAVFEHEAAAFQFVEGLSIRRNGIFRFTRHVTLQITIKFYKYTIGHCINLVVLFYNVNFKKLKKRKPNKP